MYSLMKKIREPNVENKYNLKPSDICNLIILDRSKIKDPLFWRNNVINAWCISKSIGSAAERNYCNDNGIWIGIYDKPHYNKMIRYNVTCWGGMGKYDFKKFYDYKEIESEKDLETQEELLRVVNMLIDEGILALDDLSKKHQ